MNNGWAPLSITLAIQSMVAMALLAVPAIAPRVAGAAGVSPAYIGLYIAVAYAGAMVASLASGAAVARYGPIRVSQLGLLLCAVGLVLCTVPTVPTLALGALLVGLGYGPVTPASSHLLARTTPAHRMSLVFSVKQTGVPLGGALAGAIVPGLQLLAGWQPALLAVAAANLLCAWVAQRLRAEFDADRDPSRALGLGNFLEPVRLVLSDPRLRMLAGCSFIFSIAQLSLTTYLVTYLTDSLAYGLVAAGFVLSVSQIGAVLGRVLWGYVADRWMGARRMLAALAAVMAMAAAATSALSQPVADLVVISVLFVFGASAIGWNGVYLAEVARQAPAGKAGMATGGTLAITFLGVVLGPPLFGAVSGLAGSYRAGFAALAVPLTLCALTLGLRSGKLR
ncbi:MFS transporter [Ramlibacter tataouinensis]|uniref:Candidate transporter n=1 Tax=Ramlibacter tataouinensis (strain ATCC BAA-407 / DSM 14655 / LMG 21543 / TTB310) TaxID=365046 RepID=F5Y6F2_RAMTT|nr:MFS transporter [Ramlibacter tataouinensis]AEG94026.1 Candidate transporter [Ramlibacter tataouinensis TTB310]